MLGLDTTADLRIRPFVGNDGYIRMEIHPEDSDGGVTVTGLPFKNTAEVTTNIIVKDGQTIVIGGLFRDRKVQNKKRVPLLSEVPVVGELFKADTETIKREEVIILIGG